MHCAVCTDPRNELPTATIPQYDEHWTLLQLTNKGPKIGSCSSIASFDLLMIEVNTRTAIHQDSCEVKTLAVSMENWANEIYIDDVNSKSNHDTARQPINRALWSNLTADHVFSISMNQAASYPLHARLCVCMLYTCAMPKKWA